MTRRIRLIAILDGQRGIAGDLGAPLWRQIRSTHSYMIARAKNKRKKYCATY